MSHVESPGREDHAGATFLCNREVRVVPRGWEHPRDRNGTPEPLLAADYWPQTPDEVEVWVEETGERPDPAIFMPPVGDLPIERTEIAAYETTTEGTPISPTFPNTPEGRLQLTQYCAENSTTWGHNRADEEAWAAILFGPPGAGVTTGGTVLADG